MDKTQEKRHRIKLLAVDMDGTCLDGRSRMSRETVEALREAARAGVQIENRGQIELFSEQAKLRHIRDPFLIRLFGMKIPI